MNRAIDADYTFGAAVIPSGYPNNSGPKNISLCSRYARRPRGRPSRCDAAQSVGTGAILCAINTVSQRGPILSQISCQQDRRTHLRPHAWPAVLHAQQHAIWTDSFKAAPDPPTLRRELKGI